MRSDSAAARAPGADPVLVEGLSFMYDRTPVLYDVNFSIERSDFVAMIGPNGAGKTTLAKLILGLLKPTAGSVSVFGLPPEKGCRYVGYVPQYSSFDPQFPIRVIDVVLMGLLSKPFGFYTRADREAAREALRRVGMERYAPEPFGALSGGQRQRVLIARALAGTPELLIMDEPTTNVDAAAEAQMKELLQALNERLAIVLITHDLGFVPEMVSRVLCVNGFVRIHETREVSDEMIRDLFRSHARMVDHRDRPVEGGAP
jgi:zinc transport system ATP-binding protein